MLFPVPDQFRVCPIGILTAARQNVVPQDQFRTDPEGSAMASALWWIGFAKEMGVGLELAAALPVPDSYKPAEAMLDPVASHLAVSSPKSGTRKPLSDDNAAKLIDACGEEVKIFSLGAFENLLHPDAAIREQVHAHTVNVAASGTKLKPVGCNAVTGFIGCDWTLTQDQNFDLIEPVIVPLLRRIGDLGMKFRIENCPMPGWEPGDNFFHNIAYCAANWITIFKICDANGVGDVIELNYDESHDILMGNRAARSFQVIKAAGYARKLASIHGKPLRHNAAKISAYGMHGQRIGLGNPWGVMVGDHIGLGCGHYNPIEMHEGRENDPVAHQIALRELGLDPRTIPYIMEHEWQENRVQDEARIREMFAVGVPFVRAADLMAEAFFQGAAFCAKHSISQSGVRYPILDAPAGLDQVVAGIR